MKKLLPLLFFITLGSATWAQGSWWNEANNWDRVTPWERYLILSPGYMGPNAFPVPEILDGKIGQILVLETALEGHFNAHEQTQNLFTRLFIPFKNKKVGLNIFLVPFEIFNYDTYLRDLRHSTDYDGQGVSTGDVYISTHIQLLENKVFWPDVLLNLTLKTASGNQYGAARFSDSPGYYFTLSFGKAVFKTEKAGSLRLYGMFGFYAWQTNQPDHFQDNAIVYGLGVKWQQKHFSLNQSLGGFSGYLNNGDRPSVYRIDLESNLQNNVNYKIRFQYGFNDIDYRSIRFSILYKLK